MIHEVKAQTHWFNRVKDGQKRVEVCKHDRDYQVGDEVRLVEVDKNGWRVNRWVEPGRDEKGRFTPGEHVNEAPILARITHVLPASQADGIAEGYCVLSLSVRDAMRDLFREVTP